MSISKLLDSLEVNIAEIMLYSDIDRRIRIVYCLLENLLMDLSNLLVRFVDLTYR